MPSRVDGCLGKSKSLSSLASLLARGICVSLLMAGPAFAQVVDSGDLNLFQSFTGGGGVFSLDSTSRIVFLDANGATDNTRLIEKLNAPRGLLQKLRQATGLDLKVTMVAAGSVTSKDIVLSDTPDAVLTDKFTGVTLTLTLNHGRTVRKRDISGNVQNEGYQYKVGNSGATLKFQNDLGAIRAVQSLIQIVMQDGAGPGVHRSIPTGEGIDYPKFQDRTIMLDVGRYFTPKQQLIAWMEKMSEHKVNVLHMHLNEEAPVRGRNGEPFLRDNKFEMTGFFRLDIGDVARQRRMTPDGLYYTKKDWEDIEAAGKRYGIEIIPEFGSPGHALSWIQDDPTLPQATGSGRAPNLSTSNAANRKRVGKYMADMILSFRDWFASDTIQIGLDEGFGNSWRQEVQYANNDLVPKIKCGASDADASNCFDVIRMWHIFAHWAGSHSIGSINFSPEYSVWGLSGNSTPGARSSDLWIDAILGKYWVPLYNGYLTTNSNVLNGGSANSSTGVINPFPEHMLKIHRSDIRGSYHRWPNIPIGVQYSLWNDRTRARGILGAEDAMLNGGVETAIPGIGLIGWNSEVTGDTYEQTKFNNLIPVTQEATSYWLVERFPYLAPQVAMSVFTDTSRWGKLIRGDLIIQSDRNNHVVPGSRDSKWTAWDPVDMEAAFAGPVMFRGAVIADIAGEGNMMGNGRECSDQGYAHFRERRVSACDEDTWSNAIAGTGGLTKKGVGLLRLVGSGSTFAGGVVLEGGILEIGGDGSLGAAAGGVTFSGGTLSFAADATLPSTRNLVIGSGAAAAINVNGKEVSIAGVIEGAGELRISSMQRATVTSQQQEVLVGGQGTVTVMVDVIDLIKMLPAAGGTVELSGANTFSGGVVLEGGLLKVSSVAALGTGRRLTFAGGGLGFGVAGTASQDAALSSDGWIDTGGHVVIMPGLFSGGGGVRKTGQGSLELRGSNIYFGSTRVAAGLLRADISSIPDISVIETSANATIELSTTADGKHDGLIFGSGVFRKTGGHVLALKGPSSQESWDIAGGTLTSETAFAGNVGFSGSGSREFHFKQGTDTNYGWAFSGDGTVKKSGGGALVLSGDSRSFAGTFDVEANSTLFVDNNLGGNVNVKASGVLGGKGHVGGNVAVASAGKLAASRSGGGQLVIDGSLDLDGEYEVHFGAGGFVRGEADISAGSLKVLNGLASPFDFNAERNDSDKSLFYALISNGPLIGQFASVDTSMLPFMEVSVSYETLGSGGAVILAAGLNSQALADLLREPPAPPPFPARPALPETEIPDDGQLLLSKVDPLVNTNKNRLAAIIDSNGQQDAAERSAVISELSDAIMILADDPGADEGAAGAMTAVEKRDEILESVAAEMQASAKSALLASSSEVSSAAAVQAGYALGGDAPVSERGVQETRFSLARRKWGVDRGGTGAALWVKAVGSGGRSDGEGQFADIEYDGTSALVGVDTRFGNGLLLGAFVGTSEQEFSQLSVDGGGEDKSRHMGLYGGVNWRSLFLRGGVVHTSHEVSAHRTALVLGRLSSDYEAKTMALFSEIGQRIEGDGGAVFEPFFGLNYTSHDADQFSEKREDGTDASMIAEQSTSMSRGEWGLRMLVDGPGAKVYGAMSWHMTLKKPDSIVRQALGNSQSVDIQGTPIVGSTGFSLKAGLDFAIQENLNVDLAYRYTRFTSSSRQYSFEGKITYSF